MLGDAVIILTNMRGGYIDVSSTVHTLFRMSGRTHQDKKGVDRDRGAATAVVADANADSVELAQ